jgi:hypothetical protein
MTDRDESAAREQTGAQELPARGDAGEPDAPTSGEENESMSTVLSAEPLAGVQKDESEE